MFNRVRKILFNKYFWLLFVPLLIGWALLTMRLEVRTNFAQYRQLNSVKRIWGGNLTQPMPSIRYKSIGSEVSTLSKGEIYASDVSVNVQVNYRKKGLVYYTGYDADFVGKYTIQNQKAEKVYLSFIFPYPMKQGEGMLRDVKLLVDNEEDPKDTEYQESLILWTGLVEPAQSREITVKFTGRGLNHFVYGFEPGRQINRFKMKIDISGSGDVDYPESTMTPTSVASTDNGSTLVWELDSVLTQLNIGVVLPDRINVARQISIMSRRAPVFFLMFLAAFFAILTLNKSDRNYLQASVIGVAYFLFYPLFAYLSAYMEVALSFIISFGIIGLMVFNYSRIVYNLKIALSILVAFVLFLGVTSVAALLPTYTGLILILEGVVVLAIVMQVLSKQKDIKIGELFGWTGSGKVEKNLIENKNEKHVSEDEFIIDEA